MPRCKNSGCNEEAIPGGRRYCATHLAKMRERQKAEAALPRCATPGCHQGTRRVYCGTCRREHEAKAQVYEQEAQILIDLRDCTNLEELKEFIAFQLIPNLGAKA